MAQRWPFVVSKNAMGTSRFGRNDGLSFFVHQDDECELARAKEVKGFKHGEKIPGINYEGFDLFTEAKAHGENRGGSSKKSPIRNVGSSVAQCVAAELFACILGGPAHLPSISIGL